MGHSFIDFRDKTKMMSDGDIIIVAYVLNDVAQRGSISFELTENVKALLNSWNNLIDVYAPGCLDLNLNKFILTESDRRSLLSLIKSAINTIESFGSNVSGNYLNRIVDAPAILVFYDRPTAEVLVAFDKFTELLKNSTLDKKRDFRQN